MGSSWREDQYWKNGIQRRRGMEYHSRPPERGAVGLNMLPEVKHDVQIERDIVCGRGS